MIANKDEYIDIYSRSSEYINEIEKETGNTIERIDEKFFDLKA